MILPCSLINAVSSPVIVDIDIVFSSSCDTLSSQSNISMLTNLVLAAMASSSGIPTSYITITSVNNSCGAPSRLRSLFQLSLGATKINTYGNATVKTIFTWPADVASSTGLTQAHAYQIVANCTSLRFMSSIFTPVFMDAYNIRSIPFAAILSTTDEQRPSTVINGEG